jgi:hypothetical protein
MIYGRIVIARSASAEHGFPLLAILARGMLLAKSIGPRVLGQVSQPLTASAQQLITLKRVEFLNESQQSGRELFRQ